MHDGRFKTLKQVLDHYNVGFQNGPYLDPAMQVQTHGRLTISQENDIIAFLHTLSDSSFIKNPAFSKP